MVAFGVFYFGNSMVIEVVVYYFQSCGFMLDIVFRVWFLSKRLVFEKEFACLGTIMINLCYVCTFCEMCLVNEQGALSIGHNFS